MNLKSPELSSALANVRRIRKIVRFCFDKSGDFAQLRDLQSDYLRDIQEIGLVTDVEEEQIEASCERSEFGERQWARNGEGFDKQADLELDKLPVMQQIIIEVLLVIPRFK